MANSLLTISMITREALRVLENSLTFAKQITRQYDDRFGIAGAKIGTTLNIRKPPRYVGRVGQTLALEDSTEQQVPLVLTTQRGCDIVFTSQELTLSVDDFSKRFLKPAIASVANAVDFDTASMTNGVYNVIGTPGTIPNAALTYLQAGQRLNEEACPVDDRVLIMPPSFIPPIVDSLKGLFQSSERIAEQYEKGMMGIGLGYRWFMDQNMPTFVAGLHGGTPAVVGANQTGSSLSTNGWTATTAILNPGDTFTIAGVYAVNPQNKQSTGVLRQFVVTAPVTSSGAGAATIPISPAIIPVYTGAPPPPAGSLAGFATVTASPAAGALLTLTFTPSEAAPQAVAHHPEAFAMGCADLLLPGGVDMASRVADDQLGLSIRAIRAYDINMDRFPTRLDILYGWCILYAEMACRVTA